MTDDEGQTFETILYIILTNKYNIYVYYVLEGDNKRVCLLLEL